ncbi:DnaT-like ssDNA-binding domain-containing protein [Sansalvadorimonas sp. 2012CJ34-2]|uniref:DnaT-like ssDNA-binding domain-containing protein n=1 Tax=Parendozoicomonas callyspongiae TaxID=2942213 RepID=A0ABT0PJM0_9GAMM|nr:DnaT-like ssDNA-binding domain-containing protein [Sansalvadorimonas sp. 2012CJ34-2]MCL6271563.1 DnaT-like ssDNA-binding domain-containing protein [Sansalvadorimonas sp. 2012CJ34-2]
MGDRDSDNLTRRMNREGKGLFEMWLESERQEQQSAPSRAPVSQARSMQPAEASGINQSRRQVSDLEHKLSGHEEEASNLANELKRTQIRIAEQERMLESLRNTAYQQEQELMRLQDEQRADEQALASARQQLQNAEAQYQHQHHQNNVQTAAYSGYPAGNDVFSRHRDNQVAVQARATPLPEDYQPAEWCLQKLLQHNGLTRDYAMQQLDDFKMYWLSTGEARKAWDYRFMKHVIYQWRREKGEKRTERSQPTTEELTDRSWADKYDFDFD